MTTGTAAAPYGPQYGWLRNAPFDLTFIVGVAALAIASGCAAVLDPALFPLILFLDIYLLGYHHVVSTFTRLAFDRDSFLEHRFLVVWLPLLVLGVAVSAVLVVGGWVLPTTYLYWQWFHYTRQSYGIERVYRAKASGVVPGGAVPGTDTVTKAALYLVPLWGILYRSYQAPREFLGLPVKTLPISRPIVILAGAVAVASLGVWLVQVGRGVVRDRRLCPHTLYMASHLVVFSVGYLLIDDIDHGWLVLNVWHNAQYILFVWLYNNNRYRDGVVSGQRLLSTLSQSRNWPFYFLTCLLISTLWYFGLDEVLRSLQSRSTLPLFLVAYQTINFHHYVVDGLIWKVRRKRLRTNLGIDG